MFGIKVVGEFIEKIVLLGGGVEKDNDYIVCYFFIRRKDFFMLCYLLL